MSKNRNDSYASFSEYNSVDRAPRTTYKTYKELSEEETKTQPQPQQPQQPQPQPQQQYQENVLEIDEVRLLNILTNPIYYKTKSGGVAKIILKLYTDWCKPCKLVAPEFEKISKDPRYTGILFLKINVESIQSGELKKILNCSAVPMFLGYVGGSTTHQVAGSNISEIIQMCNDIAKY